MKTTKCVNGSSKQRVLSLRDNELQVRIMGEDADLFLNQEIFKASEANGECRLGEYSRRLTVKGTERYHREFVTVTFDEEDMEEN